MAEKDYRLLKEKTSSSDQDMQERCMGKEGQGHMAVHTTHTHACTHTHTHTHISHTLYFELLYWIESNMSHIESSSLSITHSEGVLHMYTHTYCGMQAIECEILFACAHIHICY